MKKVSSVGWVLRFAVFATFLGHGIFAIRQNPDWLPFLTFWGIDETLALQLMIGIGTIDVIIAVITLVKPNRYVLMYAIFWAFITALMRPINGGSVLAFIERAAYWCTPLALLWLSKQESSSISDRS
ncbi:MAG: hypothetical protein OEQ53_01705 [Saprospiraceae bacterium]|nr:hypothetical protein [Saprospiraceae bacterium]